MHPVLLIVEPGPRSGGALPEKAADRVPVNRALHSSREKAVARVGVKPDNEEATGPGRKVGRGEINREKADAEQEIANNGSSDLIRTVTASWMNRKATLPAKPCGSSSGVATGSSD